MHSEKHNFAEVPAIHMCNSPSMIGGHAICSGERPVVDRVADFSRVCLDVCLRNPDGHVTRPYLRIRIVKQVKLPMEDDVLYHD